MKSSFAFLIEIDQHQFLLVLQGELEQLMIVPNPGAVAQQCSSTKIPIYDPTIPNEFPTAPTRRTVRKKNDESGGSEKRHTTHAGFQFLDYGKDILKGGGSHRARSESSNSVLDEDVSEGSGNGNESSFNKTKYGEFSVTLKEFTFYSMCTSGVTLLFFPFVFLRMFYLFMFGIECFLSSTCTSFKCWCRWIIFLCKFLSGYSHTVLNDCTIGLDKWDVVPILDVVVCRHLTYTQHCGTKIFFGMTRHARREYG